MNDNNANNLTDARTASLTGTTIIVPHNDPYTWPCDDCQMDRGLYRIVRPDNGMLIYVDDGRRCTSCSVIAAQTQGLNERREPTEMNRKKLERRTALADKIRDRHNPPYRVMVDGWGATPTVYSRADTRDGARKVKKSTEDRNPTFAVWIEKRRVDGTYERIR